MQGRTVMIRLFFCVGKKLQKRLTDVKKTMTDKVLSRTVIRLPGL